MIYSFSSDADNENECLSFYFGNVPPRLMFYFDTLTGFNSVSHPLRYKSQIISCAFTRASIWTSAGVKNVIHLLPLQRELFSHYFLQNFVNMNEFHPSDWNTFLLFLSPVSYCDFLLSHSGLLMTSLSPYFVDKIEAELILQNHRFLKSILYYDR